MKANAGRDADATGEVAVSNVSGDSLLISVLSRIEGELEKVLILAHVALDLPIHTLARELGLDRADVTARIERTLVALRRNHELIAQLDNIKRAGQSDHHHALAFRIGLQDWFCSQCGRPIVQPQVGRPRKTCSPKCRRLLFEAKGAGWKDQYQPATRSAATVDGDPQDSETRRRKLLQLIQSIDQSRGTWRPTASQDRDRALLLIGCTCPVPISALDLAAMDFHDVAAVPEGLEIRLFRRAEQATQYVIIPRGVKPLCPVEAIFSWRTHLISGGHATRPLFVRLDRSGQLSSYTERLTGRAISAMINKAIWSTQDIQAPRLRVSTPLSDFLDAIILS